MREFGESVSRVTNVLSGKRCKGFMEIEFQRQSNDVQYERCVFVKDMLLKAKHQRGTLIV